MPVGSGSIIYASFLVLIERLFLHLPLLPARLSCGPLLDIVDIGDEYIEQQQYADAVTHYEIIIRGILDNYHTFVRWHAYEGDLDEVIKDCMEGLGKCLLGERYDAANG